MIAFGTLKKKAAFKLYARAKKLDFNIANKNQRPNRQVRYGAEICR